MVKFHLRLFSPLRRLLRSLRKPCLPFLSLTRTPGGRHTEWCSAFIEPVMETCERSVYFVGLFCFLLVLLGITVVVATFYLSVLPFLWHTQHPVIFTLYIIYGHYLLINVCFHYYKGVYTDPGAAPKVSNFDPNKTELRKGWRVCRKCESPKPPRAHHCRICNRCILKMDHHCPWMFNCIGHNNHRYFFSFVMFMWMGTSYVVHCAWSRIFVLMEIKWEFVYSVIDIIGLRESVRAAEKIPFPSNTEGLFLFIVFFVCVGVTIALTVLGGWHLYLISVNETTIEFYTNQREAREMRKEGKVFVNPYHYGCWNNWIVFFGTMNGRSFYRHVLLPSSYKPHHNGMEWDMEDVLRFKDKLRTFPV